MYFCSFSRMALLKNKNTKYVQNFVILKWIQVEDFSEGRRIVIIFLIII